jgi:hypothetical protein
VKDNRYKSGKVRVGFGCRNYRFRNLRVTQGKKSTYKMKRYGLSRVPANSAGFVKKTGGVSFTSNEVRTRQGNYFADTKQTFYRPADMRILSTSRVVATSAVWSRSSLARGPATPATTLVWAGGADTSALV